MTKTVSCTVSFIPFVSPSPSFFRCFVDKTMANIEKLFFYCLLFTLDGLTVSILSTLRNISRIVSAFLTKKKILRAGKYKVVGIRLCRQHLWIISKRFTTTPRRRQSGGTRRSISSPAREGCKEICPFSVTSFTSVKFTQFWMNVEPSGTRNSVE